MLVIAESRTRRDNIIMNIFNELLIFNFCDNIFQQERSFAIMTGVYLPKRLLLIVNEQRSKFLHFTVSKFLYKYIVLNNHSIRQSNITVNSSRQLFIIS